MSNRIIYNGCWRNNGFSIGVHWEWWNKKDKWKELRVYFLAWEFNFNIKNTKYRSAE